MGSNNTHMTGNIGTPDGVVELDIKNFREFIQSPSNQLLSKPVYIRGLPWRILVTNNQGYNPPSTSYLSIYLRCNNDSQDPSWRCIAGAMLSVHSQTPRVSDYTRKIMHIFNIMEYDRGDKTFIRYEDLINPNKGYIKDNIIKVSAKIWCEAPISFLQREADRLAQTRLDPVHAENQVLKEEKAQLVAKLEKIKDENACLICMDRKRDIVILPCSHLACCSNCAPQVIGSTHCCICRTKIGGSLKIYK